MSVSVYNQHSDNIHAQRFGDEEQNETVFGLKRVKKVLKSQTRAVLKYSRKLKILTISLYNNVRGGFDENKNFQQLRNFVFFYTSFLCLYEHREQSWKCQCRGLQWWHFTKYNESIIIIFKS